VRALELPDITNDKEVREAIARALAEDIGAGDVTTNSLVANDEQVRAVILSRGNYVLAGAPVAALTFHLHEGSIRTEVLVEDGARISPNTEVISIEGRARTILTAERVALNFLQRMTGIATLTSRYVEIAAPEGVQILDTRKTTPTLRVFEKYAVLCGGGTNHRFGLFDRVLIKDNHRALWARHDEDNLAQAVQRAREMHPDLAIEVEVESEEELKTVLAANPDWVLLDNMPPDQMQQCVEHCKDNPCQVEASGGVSLDTLSAIAKSGVDAVSVGALTHSAVAADFSLEIANL